jgi:hypothetical protein
MSEENTKKRAFTFTINNWTEEELVAVLDIFDLCVYSIVGFEGQAEGCTPHLQGYVYFKNARTKKGVIRKFPRRAHIEIALGTAEQNMIYCSKEGEFNEFGIMPRQGDRTDLQLFKDTIITGGSEKEIIDDYTACFAKYDRFYQRCRNLCLKEIAQKLGPPEVMVIIGPPGCGKTRLVYDNHDINDIYKLEVGDGSSGSVFWNGYNGEPVILIDDFHNNLKLDYMLRLLDRYPMTLNTKGGHTWKCAKKIYITSNIELDKWYPNCPQIHKEALKRRITTVLDLSDQRTYNRTSNELICKPISTEHLLIDSKPEYLYEPSELDC